MSKEISNVHYDALKKVTVTTFTDNTFDTEPGNTMPVAEVEEETVTSTDGEVTVPLSEIQEAADEFAKLPQGVQDQIKAEQEAAGVDGEVVAEVKVDGEVVGGAVVDEEAETEGGGVVDKPKDVIGLGK